MIVKLSNSQLNTSKSAVKNEIDVVLRLSSNMIGNSDDKSNFPYELFLTNRQVASLCKAFANNLSANMKLSKTQLLKIKQLEKCIGILLGPLLKTGLPLMKNVIKPLAKSILITFGLAAAASAADTRIHKKVLVLGHHSWSSALHNNNTTLIRSNNEMKKIIEIVKFL